MSETKQDSLLSLCEDMLNLYDKLCKDVDLKNSSLSADTIHLMCTVPNKVRNQLKQFKGVKL